MKKIVVFLLIAIMAFTMVSCSSSEEETFDVDFDANGGSNGYDFNGYEVLLIGAWNPQNGDSSIGDMMVERYKEIEKEFNVKLTFQNIVYGFSGTLLSRIMAGEKYCDIMLARLNDMSYCVSSGLLFSFNDNGVFDVKDSKFGEGSLKETAMFNTEDYYGLYPTYWPYMDISINGQCLISYQVIRENNQPDPYELLENHEWNWENFEKICVAVTNKDEGKYGVTTEHDEMLNSVFFMDNIDLVRYNEQADRWVTDFTSPAAVDAAEWVSGLVEKGVVYHWGSSDSKTGAQSIFASGLSAFHVGPGYFGVGLNPIPTLEEGFGFIPMAFGPNNPDEIWNAKFDARQQYYCVPYTDNNDALISCVVLDRMFDELGTGYDWKSYYSTYVFMDDNSASCFIKMVDEASNSYFNMIGRPQLDSFNSIMRGGSPAQNIEKMSSTINALLDESFNVGQGVAKNVVW